MEASGKSQWELRIGFKRENTACTYTPGSGTLDQQLGPCTAFRVDGPPLGALLCDSLSIFHV